MIYLDNAATSHPKPEEVYQAINKTLRENFGNPGRSAHKPSIKANKIIEETRFLCKKLFNADSPENIIFTNNTTTALNLAIKGIISKGDHVLTSTLEHNSVSRPLYHLEKEGICEVTKVHTDINFGLNTDVIKKAIKRNTKLVICTHISNVTGTVNDIETIGQFCRERGLVFLVDAAQSAGARHINVQNMCIDLMAFPGHKGLLGPQGTGGLYIRNGLNIRSIFQGGTGSQSESLSHPENLPHKLEFGTLNTPGIAGLGAGIKFILEKGIDEIEKKERTLTERLIKGLQNINGVKIYGPDDWAVNRGNVVSICIENTTPGEFMLMLDCGYDIAVRSGLHCAIDAHKTIGTHDKGGTIRISPNYFNTETEIDTLLINCTQP